MNVSNREMILIWLTLAAVLLGGTFWLGEPMWDGLKEARQTRSSLRDRERLALRLMDREGDIQTRWNRLRSQMKNYPLEMKVTSEVLKQIQQTANKHDLILANRDPGEEENVGDLYEFSVKVGWRGELSALVKFLYDLQTESGMVDVSEINIRPTKDGQLEGNMTVEYAYTRSASPEPQATAAVVNPEPVQEPIQVEIGR